MVIEASPWAFWRHHACEVVLFAVLAAPVLAIRPSVGNIVAVVVFFVAYFGFSFLSDMRTRLRVDEDGVEYLAGGRDQVFIAWNETARIVPRRFRWWTAEDAIVFLDGGDRPLLVAGISMFAPADLDALEGAARAYVPVDSPVILSPFTGRADGERHPELVPQRTSERLLASSISSFLIAAVVAIVLLTVFE
ncbi:MULTISPECIES: hypothetical protein [Dermacoccus]|uniref:Uncharacterized protein n=1 Tax=Dermacoccus nishinomiyaensis TaxID=1274 RepID=A0A075JHZ9_9MICO|nr:MULTISPECIES: hypothetical protein [Dermacoccus]AIF41460.1 hypothetical protein HX89_11520 [Dermacoccus nishinomiyaensis]MCI0153682.1 hypothetical protein [Dermacoccus nishinomiyaensis]MCT1605620.1 hypothetical protein [Dermacoccus nishinomiyaensis]NHC31366.1 hypothetical protein [Dermacoccus nishinomiyaensis]